MMFTHVRELAVASEPSNMIVAFSFLVCCLLSPVLAGTPDKQLEKELKVLQEGASAQEDATKKLLLEVLAKVDRLEAELASQRSPRDLPYVTISAYKDYWSTHSQTAITYDSLVADYTNADRPGGGDGSLDITTGIFTCLTPGFYEISYSANVRMEDNETVVLYIYRNGVRIGPVGEIYAHASGHQIQTPSRHMVRRMIENYNPDYFRSFT